MNIIDKLLNITLYRNKYKTDSDGVIIACYFNPQQNPYRLIAFNKFYESIKHLNHRIVECVIGDATPELPESDSIARVYTKDLLWHKESLLNNVIKTLPKEFKYVFWLDTDVLFTNKDWFIEGIEELKYNNIIQPFEYCVHLEEGEFKPSFDVNKVRQFVSEPSKRHPNMWRSFCANFKTNDFACDCNYDKHGHVGFAWGAKRSVLDIIPLYDKALIGGADHIIAHAAAGHIGHSCILKSFTEDLDTVNDWSEDFEKVINEKISYVRGDLYHIWHGDLKNRQYLKRIQDFTPKAKQITKKDEHGLYINEDEESDKYVKDYFEQREPKGLDYSSGKKYAESQLEKLKSLNNKTIQKRKVVKPNNDSRPTDGFIESAIIGYATDSATTGAILGGNLLGGIVGDLLNGSDEKPQGFEDGFGGGDFSGGGSGGSWEEPSNDNSSSENFS